jgi:hypothetical protein
MPTGGILCAAVFAGTTLVSSALAEPQPADAALRADLRQIATQRIFFAHQSVGMNLLDGLRQLAGAADVAIRIEPSANADGVPRQSLGHAFIAQNGKPLLKLGDFRRALESKPNAVDIALLKFCYLDFSADTDAKALFERYRETIGELREINPRTTFVHVTVPLTVPQTGIKGFAKRLLGIPPYGIIENVRREEYNALLRRAYAGREPLFDLARAEATTPDGHTSTVEWQGYAVPALTPAYTDDNNHLNATGSVRAARELVGVLAAAGRARATSLAHSK